MKHFVKLAAVGLLGATFPAASHASIVVNIENVGNDIVATYSGSINKTGLIYVGGEIIETDLLSATLGIARMGTPIERILGFSVSGPLSWGSGPQSDAASSRSGDFFAIEAYHADGPRIYLPFLYRDDTLLSGSATFANVTLASLGLNVGQYVYTAPGNQTVTINIGESSVGPVPEPASWALLILGFGAMGGTFRRRQHVSARIRFA